LAPRMLPFGAVDVGPKLGLPDLPRLPILLHSRVRDGRPRDALAALSAAFRSAVRGRPTPPAKSFTASSPHRRSDMRASGKK
jgi:hypothetical protein